MEGGGAHARILAVNGCHSTPVQVNRQLVAISSPSTMWSQGDSGLQANTRLCCPLSHLSGLCFIFSVSTVALVLVGSVHSAVRTIFLTGLFVKHTCVQIRV